MPSLIYKAEFDEDGIYLLPPIRYPDGREIAPQLDMRETFELFAGVRATKVHIRHAWRRSHAAWHSAAEPIRSYPSFSLQPFESKASSL